MISQKSKGDFSSHFFSTKVHYPHEVNGFYV